MKKRYKLSKKASKKSFSRSASMTHRKNNFGTSTARFMMRGGTRL